MKIALLVVAAGALCTLGASAAHAQGRNADPTPRNFITPQGASKVRVYEAKQRRNFGVNTEVTINSSTQVSSSGYAKSCNTTIGPTGANQGTTGNTARYGAGNSNKESTVIVTGDVINVCK